MPPPNQQRSVNMCIKCTTYVRADVRFICTECKAVVHKKCKANYLKSLSSTACCKISLTKSFSITNIPTTETYSKIVPVAPSLTEIETTELMSKLQNPTTPVASGTTPTFGSSVAQATINNPPGLNSNNINSNDRLASIEHKLDSLIGLMHARMEAVEKNQAKIITTVNTHATCLNILREKFIEYQRSCHCNKKLSKTPTSEIIRSYK